MKKEGYIKLQRSLLDNPIFNCGQFSKGQAWITLLLLANYKDGFISIKNGEVIKIGRGECGYSELALADIFKWSRGKVKRFLDLLETEKMIQQKKRSNRTIIKIINYSIYQDNTVNDTVNDTVDGHKQERKERKEYINISLSNISKEEREILKNYVLRQKRKPDNVDAYIKALIKNGDYKEIVEKEKRRIERQAQKEKMQVIKSAPPVVLTPEQEAEIAKIHERFWKDKRRG